MQNISQFDRPELQTERLLLRCPKRSDSHAIVEAIGDADIARNLARVPHPYTRADADFFLEQIVPNEWTWAITIRGQDRMVGSIGLTPENGSPTAELGYWLARDYWGSGIATEAAKAVVGYGFDTLKLPHITSGYFTHNPASGRVLAKLGFVETGELQRPNLAAGSSLLAKVLRLDADRFAQREQAN